MATIEEKISQAEYIIYQFELEELGRAFDILNEVIADNRATDLEIADALNLKGFIVAGPAPCHTEYEEDETGLIYFLQALKHNPYNLGALINTVNSFTEHDMRQTFTRENTPAFIKAYEVLRYGIYDTLNKESKNDLQRLSDTYDKFKQNRL
ncbi:hypothetical protein [Psychrobacter aquimaris]|uniref:hypothetical protein n=1 Tax=Psychrobacter aquimaris TaxID=292733 RepID=UPI0018E023E5|nr:hypothetical protein [Psychrobacter aquimaris]